MAVPIEEVVSQQDLEDQEHPTGPSEPLLEGEIGRTMVGRQAPEPVGILLLLLRISARLALRRRALAGVPVGLRQLLAIVHGLRISAGTALRSVLVVSESCGSVC